MTTRSKIACGLPDKMPTDPRLLFYFCMLKFFDFLKSLDCVLGMNVLGTTCIDANVESSQFPY